MAVAMATRLVHPIRSSGRRGWRGPVSDARGRVRSGLGRSMGWARLGSRSTAGAGFGILADLARGVRGSGPSSTQPESPGSHHCSRASTATRGRDADQGPNARQLGDGVGSGVTLGRAAKAVPNGLEETRTGPWGAEDDLAAFPQGEDRPIRLDKIKNLHSLDSIATETYGTHGRLTYRED